MSEGLEALHNPRIKSAKVDISAEGKHDIAYMFFDDTKQYAAIENELKEYEQHKAIEQELGIDLVTLFKALKNGCYIKPWEEIKYSYEIRTGSDNINLFLLDENDNDYSLKDYGKTWALTKEELEK